MVLQVLAICFSFPAAAVQNNRMPFPGLYEAKESTLCGLSVVVNNRKRTPRTFYSHELKKPESQYEIPAHAFLSEQVLRLLSILYTSKIPRTGYPVPLPQKPESDKNSQKQSLQPPFLPSPVPFL